MNRFLVTGGSGFIGSNFIRFLLREEPQAFVINFDKLTYAGNPENLKEIEHHQNYRFVLGDVCDGRLVQELVGQVDWVVHFASETHVDRSIDSSEDFIQTNVVGTRVLLDSILKSRRLQKFIHFSTDEVYGPISRGSVSEESPFRPTSPYAASKAAADLLVQAYQKTHRIPAVILRGCNNFGPHQYPEKVIPLFITNLLEGKKVPLYSRGENVREWIYAEDTCRAIQLACRRGQAGEAYNIGSDFEITNFELAKMILSFLGFDEKQISFVKDRLAHDIRYRLDSTKIKQLGFRPANSFRAGLEATIGWYRNHEAWWKPLVK